MARSLTSAVIDETVKGGVRLAYLAELALDSGTLRMWTGRRPLVWDGNTFTGTGTFGNISSIGEGINVQATGIRLDLNGVSSALISILLGEHYQGRRCTVWLAFFDEAWALIDDPVLLFGGRLDVPDVVDGGTDCSISITAENRLVDFAKPCEVRYWTDQDQRRRFNGDKGCAFIEALQDKTIVWGRKQPDAKSPPKPVGAGGGSTGGSSDDGSGGVDGQVFDDSFAGHGGNAANDIINSGTPGPSLNEGYNDV